MRILLFFVLLLSFVSQDSVAQRITYSEYNKKEGREINFEILGRFDTSVLVYKKIGRKHFVTRYDQQMQIADHSQLDFLDEKTFNLDFISYPDYYYIIYQYQKNYVVYCNAVKMSPSGKPLADPMFLDSTRISFFADNKIYSLSFSENKQRILVYKRQVKNDQLSVAARLFDQDFHQLDSTRKVMKYDDRGDFYSDLVVANNGDFLFARGTWKSNREKINTLHILLHKPGLDTFRFYQISLGQQYVNEVAIRADNLNANYYLNAFYSERKNRYVEGLFTAIVDMNGTKAVQAVFNPISDSLRKIINPGDRSSMSFDNLAIRNIILKKKGGFVVTAEDYFTETFNNNIWNRNYSFYNNFYSGTANDYFLNNPYYYYGYRPWNQSARDITVRYYCNDILVMSLDSSLKLQWNNIIHKSQYDVDSENFLSFSLMNSGGEVHFLFIDRDNQRQIISNHALQSNGEIKRYPTIRSNEFGYGFMPRLAKQISARSVIVPYVYMNYIAFARIDFYD